MTTLRHSFASLMFLLCAITVRAEDKPKTELTVDASEQALIDSVNKSRKEKDLPPLKANPILFKVARAHSANMARQNEMKHELDGKTPAQRVKAAGYNYRRTGENIAMGHHTFSLDQVHKAWMDSEGHRDNILSTGYSEIGIGIAKNDNGELFYTQVFGRRLK